MKILFNIIVGIALLTSCGVLEPKETPGRDKSGTVYIEYNGTVTSGNSSMASFTMVNDSPESIKYFAYDATSPHYSTEALADTGWAYLMWNWCGTGAEYFNLGTDLSFNFLVMLPNENCTWRVILNTTDMDDSNYRILRSESIEYSTP